MPVISSLSSSKLQLNELSAKKVNFCRKLEVIINKIASFVKNVFFSFLELFNSKQNTKQLTYTPISPIPPVVIQPSTARIPVAPTAIPKLIQVPSLLSTDTPLMPSADAQSSTALIPVAPSAISNLFQVSRPSWRDMPPSQSLDLVEKRDVTLVVPLMTHASVSPIGSLYVRRVIDSPQPNYNYEVQVEGLRAKRWFVTKEVMQSLLDNPQLFIKNLMKRDPEAITGPSSLPLLTLVGEPVESLSDELIHLNPLNSKRSAPQYETISQDIFDAWMVKFSDVVEVPRHSLVLDLRSMDESIGSRGSVSGISSWQSINPYKIDLSLRREIASAAETLGFNGTSNLLPYIWDALSHGNFKDDQAVTFQDNRIVPTDTPNSQDPAVFMHLLSATYGVSLATIIAGRYQLHDKSSLTWKDVRQAFIGIGANVRVSDLRELHKAISTGSEHILASFYLSLEQKAVFSSDEEFEDLSDAQLSLLIQAFRTLPVGDKKVPTLEALYPEDSIKELGSNQFEKDFDLLKAVGSLHTLDLNHLDEAMSELQAKKYGYIELDFGMVLPYLRPDGSITYYKVESKLEDISQRDGVIARLLTPVKTDILSDEVPTFTLDFRGTQPMSSKMHSGASVLRDADFRGVGKASFESREAELLKMLTLKLRDPSISSINLDINGHSLGGADVQRMLELLVRALAADGHDKALDKIASITASAHNAPSLEPEANVSFEKNLRELESQNSNLKIHLRYFYFQRDAVQLAGNNYVGAGVKSSLLNREVIYVTSPELNLLNAHGARAFTTDTPLKSLEWAVIGEDKPEVLDSFMVGNKHLRRILTPLKFAVGAAAYGAFKAYHSLHQYFTEDSVPEMIYPRNIFPTPRVIAPLGEA